MAASNLQGFITEWTGQVIPFTDVPTGSCMAVAHQYIFEVLGLTNPLIISGQYAYEVYTNFANLPANQYFNLVANSLTNVPNPGDIIVFGQNATDTPEGHLSLFVSGDVNSFVSFDQNYPTGSSAHLQNHVYTGSETVLGWLTPKTSSPTTNVDVTTPQLTDQLNAEIAALNSCQTQLKEASAQNATLQSQLTTAQDEIQSLQGQLKDANTQITTLQTQLSGEQKEIINLNTTIEQQAASNKDYATEIYTLSNANTSLTSSFNSVVDGLGVVRGTQTLAQITKAALTKEDDLDTLIKAAGVSEGILHNMAQTLQLDNPNATDQQVANNIIAYVKSLQGRLQNLLPTNPQTNTTATKSWNPLVWLGLWQPKS